MKCPKCGGSLMGDGYTTVLHCERVTGTLIEVEPDSHPVFCEDDEPIDRSEQ